jgi:hypothetical protein
LIGKDVLWIEAVAGVLDARHRMEQIAAASPGQYFVFDVSSRSVLAQIDTRKQLLSACEQKAKSA